MARLGPAQKLAWTAALEGCSAPWVAFGLDAGIPLGSDRVTGMAALIDWRVHGQVSARIANELAPNSFCLFPVSATGQTFLLYHYGTPPDAKLLAERARNLGVTALTLATSTFPEDFLPKLKQALEKQGVRVATLEPPEQVT